MTDFIQRERLPIILVENAIIEDDKVSIYAKVVYMVLCDHADWPSHETIARQASCSKENIKIAIDELVKRDYIEAPKPKGGVK